MAIEIFTIMNELLLIFLLAFEKKKENVVLA